ncbi:YdcH family protein [Pseudoalteromonas shioyasakiensis]|uniref:YdcH family protein n=1 Tax=Pseudoalteromonas shioyasakiensis TaxID=1190813 RepID=UPI0021178F6F|nr:YdcH family protein [Pseudoalteromonas shioyasakiensis]MCQ8879289.1 YdcH family protein [Pseudoalteromonas shioyasakiensis]
MLGEDHSLTKEFPEYLNTIATLNSESAEFSAKAEQYDAIDKEVRVLELQDAPIDDQSMQKMKIERAELKDWLHHTLMSAHSS